MHGVAQILFMPTGPGFGESRFVPSPRMASKKAKPQPHTVAGADFADEDASRVGSFPPGSAPQQAS